MSLHSDEILTILSLRLICCVLWKNKNIKYDCLMHKLSQNHQNRSNSAKPSVLHTNGKHFIKYSSKNIIDTMNVCGFSLIRIVFILFIRIIDDIYNLPIVSNTYEQALRAS